MWNWHKIIGFQTDRINKKAWHCRWGWWIRIDLYVQYIHWSLWKITDWCMFPRFNSSWNIYILLFLVLLTDACFLNPIPHERYTFSYFRSEIKSSYKVFVFCCFKSETRPKQNRCRSIASSTWLMMTVSSSEYHSKYATFIIQNVLHARIRTSHIAAYTDDPLNHRLNSTSHRFILASLPLLERGEVPAHTIR